MAPASRHAPAAAGAVLLASVGLVAYRSHSSAAVATVSLAAAPAAVDAPSEEARAASSARAAPSDLRADMTTVVNQNNLTKMTWASTDPILVQEFFLKYVPSHKALDGCDPYCECGVQGRVTCNGTSDFGLHATNDMVHPSGTKSVADLEEIFTSKYAAFAEYTDVMDHHVGLWTPDLDLTIVMLREEAIPFLTLSWTSVDGLSYYSVLVAVPKTMVLVEFVGVPPSASALGDGAVLAVDVPRCAQSLAHLSRDGATETQMTPLWISRASSDANRDAAWYASHFWASTVYNETTTDALGNTNTHIYMIINPSDYVFHWELHFVQRPPSSLGGMTIADVEGYFKEVHRSVILSPVCGFDSWIDNHYGMNMPPQSVHKDAVSGYYLDRLLRSLDTDAGNTYRLYKQTVLDAGVLYALYVVEPGGYSLQINGYLESAPELVPTWNFTLCGQGYCSSSLGDGIHRWDLPRDPAPTNPTG